MKKSKSSIGRSAKNKGKRGEREFAKLLREKFNINAARGVQFQGSTDSPDVTLGSLSDHLHFEVKRTEKLGLWAAIEQAECDSNCKQVAVVAHRSNKKDWIVIMKASEMDRFADAFFNRKEDKNEPTQPCSCRSDP